MTIATCEGCNERTFLIPLHGSKGGPLRCPLCAGKWHAEHRKRRRHGRIVIRALRAYLDNGGRVRDIEKLQQSAICSDFLGEDLFGTGIADPLGYLTGVATNAKGEIIELTSELLADAIKLVHPDHHPPERKELAHRVTQGLLALQPFVFPAPKKPPPEPSVTDFSTTPTRPERAVTKSPTYPCADCRDTTPYFYCDPCKAEWERRGAKEDEQSRAKQRKWYARRKARQWHSKACESCGVSFKISGGGGKHKRSDARFCSDACRQKAHRKAVTGKLNAAKRTLTNRDGLGAAILALLNRHSAVFLNDILSTYTTAQYQALRLAALRLEDEGKITSWYYYARFGRPGHKVLLRPGYEIKHPDHIPRLKPDERIKAETAAT